MEWFQRDRIAAWLGYNLLFIDDDIITHYYIDVNFLINILYDALYDKSSHEFLPATNYKNIYSNLLITAFEVVDNRGR